MEDLTVQRIEASLAARGEPVSGTKLRRVLAACVTQPWAMTEEKLSEIEAFLELRLEGHLSDDEIRAQLMRPSRRTVSPPTGVALIPVHGVISKRTSMLSEFSGGTSVEKLRETVEAACRDAARGDVLTPANFNAPGQIVIAGASAAVDRCVQELKNRGVRKLVPLPVSVPSHCALMRPAADALAPLIAALPLARLRIPLINNADAAPLTDPEEIRSSLLRQLTSAVRWDESIRLMGREGCRLFVEIGPGRVLGGLVKRILPDAEVLSVSGLEGLKSLKDRLSC